MSENKPNIQWYPGHMAKARRLMQEDMKLIDLVIEIVDARVVRSSRNPEIDKLAGQKSRLILLNKSDLSEDSENARWIQYFAAQNIGVVALDARTRSQMKKVVAAAQEACKEKIERDKRRGILNRPIRAMVVGIPNVGKSTFINSFSGKTVAKTGNKPGVTKGNQWIRIDSKLELLDTPGLLWPKFEDPIVGMHLAYIGSINDDIINKEELCMHFIEELLVRFPDALTKRYEVSCEGKKPHEIIEEIAIKKSCLVKGGDPDMKRVSNMILDDYRSGRLGKISIEVVE
ncbi:MAG: ribosome biogenesis GTPase YlqF [Lachnospiraceae bacterium]|nr:ribosome biogenesis GTPase YlqF [Lachnospiraceae bacterium]